jgi:hypothetical protein
MHETVQLRALRTARDASLLRQLGKVTESSPIRATARFAADLREDTESPRDAFRRWIDALRRQSFSDWATLSATAIAALDATSGQGRPWVLTREEQRSVARIPFVRAMFLVRGRLAGHPPVLRPEMLLVYPPTGSAPDLGRLLDAACSSGAGDLVERILEISAQDGTSRPRLPVCGTHATPVSRRSDLLAAWIIEDLQQISSQALTWSRSLADVSEEQFASFLAALHRSPMRQPHPTVRSALVALGVAAPHRLVRLAEAAPSALVPTVRRAVALAFQLTEQSGGRLHPELERLRNALVRPSDTR